MARKRKRPVRRVPKRKHGTSWKRLLRDLQRQHATSEAAQANLKQWVSGQPVPRRPLAGAYKRTLLPPAEKIDVIGPHVEKGRLVTSPADWVPPGGLSTVENFVQTVWFIDDKNAQRDTEELVYELTERHGNNCRIMISVGNGFGPGSFHPEGIAELHPKDVHWISTPYDLPSRALREVSTIFTRTTASVKDLSTAIGISGHVWFRVELLLPGYIPPGET